MIFIIDNYDSFTYNLVQEIGKQGYAMSIYRNDKISIAGIEKKKPHALIISPGPGEPFQAGISVEAISHFAGKIPILGVCLGHQAIGAAFGAHIVRAHRLMHGKTSFIYHDGRSIYRGIDNPFEATRYHSLIIDKKSLPGSFAVTAWTREGEIMGIRHRRCFVEGVQFHPESFMTHQGSEVIRNFLKKVRGG